MSKIEVNTVEPQCGTTLTLGASGDTVQLGSGASQTGFGRTGTVDWQTGSIKTATFTAVNGEGYFANTSAGAFVMNLPAGSAGAIVSVVDYTNTFQTYSLTVTPNGSEKIGGGVGGDSAILATEGQSVTFVYVDANEGWKNIQDSTSNVIGENFISASVSGSCNTLASDGDYKVATFKNPGTFTVNCVSTCAGNNRVSYAVVGAGGGGGRDNYTDSRGGGGGGAGGFREDKSPVTPYTASPLDGAGAITVSATTYPITVGGGGTAGSGTAIPVVGGGQGNLSTFSTITSAGGGGGMGHASPGCGGNTSPNPPTNGGSGGGYQCGAAAGAGNTPPTSPPQGQNAGTASGPPGYAYGGGGGAGGVGGDASPPTTGGAGGVGVTTSISGSSVAYAGGGGSTGEIANGAGSPCGTGGAAPSPPSDPANDGTAYRGGAGGGTRNKDGGAGGSGVVIIRYRFQ